MKKYFLLLLLFLILCFTRIDIEAQAFTVKGESALQIGNGLIPLLPTSVLGTEYQPFYYGYFNNLYTDRAYLKYLFVDSLRMYNGTPFALADTSYINSVVSVKADSVDVLTKYNSVPYTPVGDYSPAPKKYVDDMVNSTKINFISSVTDLYINWNSANTFFAKLFDDYSIELTNPIEGKEITIIVENPDTFDITYSAAGFAMLWKDGVVPELHDSSVNIYKFNRVNGYVLGELLGFYKIPVIEEPDTTTVPPSDSVYYYVNTNITDIYYVNASKFQVLDGRILPNPAIKIGTNTYNLKMSRGEKRGISFLITYKNSNLNDIEIHYTNFTSNGNIITSDNFDSYFMPVWWQAEINGGDEDAPGILTQELLVKDPTLIQTDYTAYNNSIKGIQLSSYNGTSGTVQYLNTNTAFPKYFKIQDSTILKPFNITNSEQRHKQIWTDISIPSDQNSGLYKGYCYITIDNGNDTLAIFPISIRVNNFDLASSNWPIGTYYNGDIHENWYNSTIPNDPNSTFDDTYNALNNWYRYDSKDSIQLEAELRTMCDHGIIYPQSNVTSDNGEHAILKRIKQRLGMPTDKIFILNSNFQSCSQAYKDFSLGLITQATLDSRKSSMISQITKHINSLTSLGYTQDNIYFYGHDEANSSTYDFDPGEITTLAAAELAYDYLQTQLPGTLIFEAISAFGNNFEMANDWLDLPIFFMNWDWKDKNGNLLMANSTTDADMINWKNIRDDVWGYSNPQMGRENPEVYRRNLGWLGWKRGATGMYGWRYTSTQGLMYYDKDGEYRDPNMIYPVYHGALQTIQLKGIRDAYYDMKYLQTLLNIKDTLSNATLLANTNVFITNFKNWIGVNYETYYDEGGIDGIRMDELRDTLIGFINYLYNPNGSAETNWYDVYASNLTLSVDTSKIAALLEDFPVAVDLSTLSSTFWDNIKSDGSDIVFTDANNVKLPRMITGFDKTNSKGIAYFKADTLSDEKHTFKIYYNYAGGSESNSSDVWRNEYELVMGFNENYDDIYDYTGKHAVSIGTGRTTDDKVTGILGYAADFDGTVSDSINVGYINPGISDWTLTSSAQIKNTEVTGTYGYLLSAGAGTNTQAGMFFGIYMADTSLAMAISNGTERQSRLSTNKASRNVWQNYGVGLYRAAGINKKFWINGTVDLGTTSAFYSSDDIVSALSATIGSKSGISGLKGMIDELRLYRGQLTDEWIETENNNLSSPSTFITVQ
jgi:hypothetical protein